VIGNFENIRSAIEKLRAADIFVSIFIDPDAEQITAAKNAGAQQVELCTAEYAELTLSEPGAIATGSSPKVLAEIGRIHAAAVHAHSLGLKVAAGHGLTYRNVAALAAIPEITEFNIGHNIISRAVFVGLDRAVREMIEAIQ
jgi:pyridoxine 5-phosphate synthase